MTQGIHTLLAEPDRFAAEALGNLQGLGSVTSGPVTRDELLHLVGDAHVLWVRLAHRIDAEVLARAPKLRFIVSPTTGLDHIDLVAAAAQGVTVLSLRGEEALLDSIAATAEHTWALLLGLVRRVPWAFDDVRSGGWDRDRFRGRDLSGRHLGVVGCGRLGRKVARYGLAFGMDVATFDVDPARTVAGALACDTLEALLRRSDVVSVHVHLDDSTANLIGATELHVMPAGAVLVNTSRGGIIDEPALVAALESGHLAGAALDVVMGEPDPAAHSNPLVARSKTHDDVLITPHIGGATSDAMAQTELFMARKLLAQVQGDRGSV